jgi:hypothetical protein
MRLIDRDQAVVIAEACIRDAGVGMLQLLGADYHSDHEMSDATEQRLWSLGGTVKQIEKMKEILKKRPPQPAWHVRFLLRDPRYVDGITVAIVKIDDATGAADLEVFERGDPAAEHG